ncbi:hypothetical protein ACFFX0_06435 [Citricoccus parietis]|uniref:Uncharacterized protein n=1 Tax=Citricoccus parietis TaxID=592307 RepID=A0ABV5FW19_9MICC
MRSSARSPRRPRPARWTSSCSTSRRNVRARSTNTATSPPPTSRALTPMGWRTRSRPASCAPAARSRRSAGRIFPTAPGSPRRSVRLPEGTGPRRFPSEWRRSGTVHQAGVAGHECGLGA